MIDGTMGMLYLSISFVAFLGTLPNVTFFQSLAPIKRKIIEQASDAMIAMT